ncbi:MAG: serine hydrolase domain-containing protein [bacterium]
MGNLKIFEQETQYGPDDVGFIPEKVRVLDNHLMKLIEDKRLQGAGYLLSKGNKIFVHKSMGKLRWDDDRSEFMPDSIWNLASITKLFTAAAILQLVENGQVRIDQPLMEIMDEFNHPLFNSITIFHLLTHTSDLCPDPGAYFEPYPARRNWYNKKNWIEGLLSGHTRVEPGKEWRYSSAGFTLLGEIVSRVSGTRYDEYVVENILKPLGMNDTFFEIPEDKLSRACLSDGVTEEKIKKWMDEYRNRPDWAPPKAGGGLASTLDDLQKFANMIINKGQYNGNRILSRKTVERMTRNQLKGVMDNCWENVNFEKAYGLGIKVHENNFLLTPGTVSHEGAGLSALYIDPEEKFVFAMFGPLYKGVEWEARAIFNSLNIVWSGLE